MLNALSDRGEVEMYAERLPNSTRERLIVALPGVTGDSNAPEWKGAVEITPDLEYLDKHERSAASEHARPDATGVLSDDPPADYDPIVDFEGKLIPQSVMSELDTARRREGPVVDFVLAQFAEMQEEEGDK